MTYRERQRLADIQEKTKRRATRPGSLPRARRSRTAAVSDPGGSFGERVIARESGGDAQVMKAAGHYGLYQFSASTWAGVSV